MFLTKKKLSGLGFITLLVAGLFAGGMVGVSTHDALAQYRFSQPMMRSHGSYYGYQYVSKSFTPTSTGYGTVVVYCPSGWVVSGGGFDTGSTGATIVPRSSHYAGAKQAWQVGYWVITPGDTVTVYAVCNQ